MLSSTVQSDVRKAIAPLRRRLVAQKLLVWTLRGSVVGGLLAAGILLAGHMTTWPAAHMIAVGAVVTGIVVGLCAGIWQRPTVVTALRLADRRLGLHDRLLTAWEYAETAGALAAMQRNETETVLGGMAPRRAAPWSIPRRETPALLGTCAVLAVVVWLPNPMDARSRQQAMEQAHLRAAAAAVHHILPPVQRAANPAQTHSSASDAQLRAKIAQLLNALQAQLQQSKSTAASLRAVSRTQQELASLAPAHSAEAASALQAVSSALAKAGQATNANKSSAGNASAAASALQSLSQSTASMTAAQQAALAKALARAANQASGTPKLGGSLQQAAAALGRNDSAGAKSALTSAAKAAQEASAAAQAASEIAATNKALDTLKNQIANTPNTGGQPAGQAPSQQASGQSNTASQTQGSPSGQQLAQSGGQASGQDQSGQQQPGAAAGEHSSGTSSSSSQAGSQSAGASTGQGQSQRSGTQTGQGQGQSQSQGSAASSGQGQTTSQAGSAGSGQGQAGNATGANGQGTGASTQASSGQGQGAASSTLAAGGGQGQGQGGSTGAGQGQGKNGERIYVPGTTRQGPQTTTKGSSAEPSSGQSLPYQDVLASYANSAMSSLERQSLPPTLQTEVGRYFATLNK